MNDVDHNRYVRWQDHRVTQLSFSINLFLGFSVASLVFVINLLVGNEKGNGLLETILTVWAFCAGTGCLATVTRLLDFRYTARKIKRAGKFNTFMAKYSGQLTWGFFWSQILTYLIGSYLFITQYVLS